MASFLFTTLLLALLLLCCNTTHATTTTLVGSSSVKFDPSITSSTSLPPSSSSFVEAKNSQFGLNGAPFLFNGFNSYWMMTVAAQVEQRHKVSEVFEQAKAAGLSVCRTWAFSDGSGPQALQLSPGLYSEAVFQGLDFVISEARKHGIRLILTLTNNYKDFGGRQQYVSWARNVGVPVGGDDDFYTHPLLKWYYKNHITRVLTRINTITGIAYKDDPTIMAWELINEPRCEVDLSGDTITGWVQEMGSYLKLIDNKHLLAVGMEGFYGDSTPDRKNVNPGYQVGTDFITSNLIESIDFATIHAYPDAWLGGQSRYDQMTFLQNWITSHLTDSQTILRKPLVLAEFGLSKKTPGVTNMGRDLFLNAVYRTIFGSARSGGTIGGGLVWQVLADGMESYNDGYEIVLSECPATRFVIGLQSRRMSALQHVLAGA